jgi:nitroreductase
VDTYLTIASKRDQRSYEPAPPPADVLARVLAAGRVCGNAMNLQTRRFVVLADATRERAAAMVTRPSNLERATAAIAIVNKGADQWASFDAGRVAQNMMLAAWNDGVGSCPNAIAQPEQLAELLGLDEDEQVAIVLSFGFPPGRGEPASRSAEEWLARADRVALDDLVSEA